MPAANPVPPPAEAAAPAPLTSPPRPGLAFRVGIIGHRPKRLGEAGADLHVLAGHLRAVLATVKEEVAAFRGAHPDLYDGAPPALRALSPLAEGSDRIFAREAIALGFELCCPMPFQEAEYRADFRPPASEEAGSERTFEDLLDSARAGRGLITFELDGSRRDSGAAYGAAGRVVLNQSDLLVVVWDGGPPRGHGGTVNTIYEANAFHVPILWIDAARPHGCQLLRAEDELPERPTGEERRRPSGPGEPPLDGIRELVRKTLECPPPEPVRRGDGARRSWWGARLWHLLWDPLQSTLGGRRPDTHTSFVRERRPRCHPWFVWRLFRDLVGDGKWSFQGFGVQDFERAVAPKWPVAPGDVPEDPERRRPLSPIEVWVNERLRPYYAWSDRPAVLKSDAYRSAFVLAYLLAAAAVFLGLGPVTVDALGYEPLEVWWALGELVAVGGIFLLVACGWWWRWHDRWVDYRLLGERIRQLRLLIPLGGGRPFMRQPPHLETYPNPERSWMSWYMRAVARQVGIPIAKVDRAYVMECLGCVERVVEDQLGYHEGTKGRDGRIAHRLHTATVIVLVVTLAGVAVHLLVPLSEAWKAVLTLGSAGLPALGAALAGITNQGEFARVHRRSSAMHQRFVQFQEDIGRLKGPGAAPTSGEVTGLATEIAQLMVDEVLDWRVVFLDRPLRTP